jgi:hypothetical protein
MAVIKPPLMVFLLLGALLALGGGVADASAVSRASVVVVSAAVTSAILYRL